MKARLAAANYSLFPATNTIHTLRWLTIDTSTTTSPAQSSNAGLHVGDGGLLLGKLVSEPILTAWCLVMHSCL